MPRVRVGDGRGWTPQRMSIPREEGCPATWSKVIYKVQVDGSETQVLGTLLLPRCRQQSQANAK